MGRKHEFKTRKTASGWIVSIPADLSADKKPHRNFFRTRELAEAKISELKQDFRSGVRGSVLSATVALQAAEAIAILEGSGVSLPEAARMAVAKLGGKESQESFAARYERCKTGNAKRWSVKYTAQMKAIPRWLPADFMERQCGTIDRSVIEAALLGIRAGLKRSSLDMKSARILAVLGYRERHKKSAEIAILSPERVDGLLSACKAGSETFAVAMLLFAGIRPDAEDGEISRLDWSAVGKDEIYISGKVSKTSSDRHIPISERLRRLIKGHPASGDVTPKNWKRVWARLRKTAEVSEFDVCRHTFASNFLAAHGEEACKSALGHAKGSQTLFRHYRRAVTKADGEKYFA